MGVSKKMRIFLVGLVLSLSPLCQAYDEPYDEPYGGKHLLVETEDDPYVGSDDDNEVGRKSLRSGGDCQCFNPWSGNPTHEHMGDPRNTCPRVFCFVRCGSGCRDEKPGRSPRRCISRIACNFI